MLQEPNDMLQWLPHTQLVFGARIENQSKNVNTGYPNIDSLANIPEGTGLQTSAETMIMQYATSRTVFCDKSAPTNMAITPGKKKSIKMLGMELRKNAG